MNWNILRIFKDLQRKTTSVNTFIVVKFVCKSCGKVFQANLPYKRAKDVSDISCVCDECLFRRKQTVCIDVPFEVVEERLV